jgi:hypothetical protein
VFESFLVRVAINRCLAHPAPSGRFSIDENKIFRAFGFIVEDDHSIFRVSEKCEHGYTGFYILSETERTQACLPYYSSQSLKIDIRTWDYGTYYQYSNAVDFLLSICSLRPVRRKLRERIRQSIYNVSARFRHTRIDLLRRMIEADISHDNAYGRKTFDSIFFFGDVYGLLAFGHPDQQKELRKFELLLDSLVSSGDLEKSEGRYRLTGQALETISKYEAEERRHADNKLHNWLIFVLTAVIAGSTAYQVFG